MFLTDELKKKMKKSIIRSEQQKHELLFALCENQQGNISLSKQVGRSNKKDEIGFSPKQLKSSCRTGGSKVVGDFHTHPYSQSMKNLGEKAKDVYISSGDITHLGELSNKFKNNFVGCIGGKVRENGKYVNRVRCFDNETVRPVVMNYVRRKQNSCKKYNKCTDFINGIRRCEYERAAQTTAFMFDERNLANRYSCKYDI